MRFPRLTLPLLILVIAAIAVPALAAPARTGTLSASAPVFKWDGGPGNGVGQPGVPFGAVRCQPAVYECEDTLVELKDAALSLTVEIKAGAGSNDLDVRFFKTDQNGEIPSDQNGSPEDISENKDAKITAKNLKPGYYLIRVAFYNATQGVYAGTATLTPAVTAPPAPAATPAPTATPAPAPAAKPKPKKKSKKAACTKKAKKIKNKKKRAKAVKKCKKIKN